MQPVVQSADVPASITAEGGGCWAAAAWWRSGSVVSGGIGFIVGGHPTRRLGPGATQHVPPDVWRGIVTHAPPREEALGV